MGHFLHRAIARWAKYTHGALLQLKCGRDVHWRRSSTPKRVVVQRAATACQIFKFKFKLILCYSNEAGDRKNFLFFSSSRPVPAKTALKLKGNLRPLKRLLTLDGTKSAIKIFFFLEFLKGAMCFECSRLFLNEVAARGKLAKQLVTRHAQKLVANNISPRRRKPRPPAL